MKRSRIIIIALVAITVPVLLASYRFNDTAATKNELLLQVMMQSLSSAHYAPEELNDSLSKRVYDEYLQDLDYNKRFLIAEDIKALEKYKYEIDDQIKKASYEFFELSVQLLEKRIKENEAYYKEILSKPFDFTKDETLELDYKKSVYPAGKDEQKEVWRKALKYDAMTRLASLIETQEKAKEKKDTSVKIKPINELEQEARKKSEKSNDELFKRISQIKKTERLAVYLNSIALTHDPHTEYFAPREKEQFDIYMSGQLEGIGAQLQEREGIIKVTNIVPGSASWKQGQLKAGDAILKVAQGSAEPVEVTDMRLDDVVALIRGKKGTEVRLTVKKADASTIIIPITRDIVVIEETYAQAAILKSSKKNIGYIKLPGFYTDMNRSGGRSSASDIKKEVLRLKKEGVSGIIIDLRDNGGGSLQDVVDMGGLFIERGPIVQVKGREKYPAVYEDYDAAIHYNGPLVIMVNAGSASASEILAAAMQDYQRAVIVGTSNTTFGKGTVQRVFNLDDYLIPEFQSFRPLGSLKITMQKFYRINGGATQLRGVTPDIVLPDAYSLFDIGEKEQDYPMPWDEIEAANYKKWTGIDVNKVKEQSKKRVDVNASFSLVKEQARKLKRQRDSSTVTLNLAAYQDRLKRQKEEDKKYESLSKDINGFDVVSLKEDLAALASDTVKAVRNKDWFKNIRKDIYLSEAAAVISDLQK